MCSSLLVPARARAVDIGSVDSKPVQLDVTETTIVAQHFDARTPPDGPSPASKIPPRRPSRTAAGASGSTASTPRYAGSRWTAGLRLDSAVYWRRPADNPTYATQYPAYKTQLQQDNESRFRNSIYPAKLWLTYAAPGLGITAGDSYVQFGRGLTLSMRKVDELGIDTTVRGAKVQLSADPFAVTAVAGFANPSRVDEATGRALFVTCQPGRERSPAAGVRERPPGGARLPAGRGLPVTLSTHLVRFTRCAPYHYEGANIDTDLASDPGAVTFGTCNSTDTDTWLSSLNDAPRGLKAHDITMVGQSLEVPSLGGHGKLYVEAAVQQRQE